MDKWTNRQMDKYTNRQVDKYSKWTNRQMDNGTWQKETKKNVKIVKQSKRQTDLCSTDKWTDGQQHKWTNKQNVQMGK